MDKQATTQARIAAWKDEQRERCAMWLRGGQCGAKRVEGSRYCAICDGGRRFR